MAIATLDTVVLDCPDPLALARFYAEVLGGEPVALGEGTDSWIELRGAPGTPLSFQAAPGFVPPSWPAAETPQQFHLDLMVRDLDVAEKGVLALGAVPLDTADRERTFRVYADPAGHPFCLCSS
ncbi:VOC family protein [Streptomyces sp. NPDC059142]|uniref:VOC family protein n=1 Tax=Streptomyces sp. NPDC059142 TaxID=3346739 RepID=UPI0036BD1F0F